VGRTKEDNSFGKKGRALKNFGKVDFISSKYKTQTCRKIEISENG
jgi:hypothetical protein